MSPQTYPTAKRDDRNSHAVTRGRAHTGTVLRHEMTVVALGVADVVVSAGGWLYDRAMAGWQVNVLLADRTGERALRILGAAPFDLSGELDVVTDDPDRVATVAVAADVYAADDRVRRFVATSSRRRAEVALWGDAGSFTENANAVAYRLTAAARAFKTQALLAVGLSGEPATTEALFLSGVTVLAPVAVRS